MPNEYVAEVLAKLSSNPTAQDLDYFIEAHAKVGYLAGVAQSIAEQREADRKFHEAQSYADARRNGSKSATDAQASATIATKDQRDSEITARGNAVKMKNLLDSIEQAINGIKYLGRATDVNLPGMRR
jgi:hypothetical protein